MSFSNSSGGTLALPSPTHAHQIDVTSAVRSLRRSMSRSPSKLLTRSNSYTSTTSEPSQHASDHSPCRRFGSTPIQQQPLPTHTQSAPPLVSTINASSPHQSVFTPFRSSVRLSLRSAKAAKSPSRPLTRARMSPRSPLKRALSSASDGGNSLPSILSTLESAGQENNAIISISPTARKVSDKPARHSVHLDVSGSSQSSNFLKSLDTNTDNHMTPTTGALKRSDATMNLDQPSQGSPVAKRRSLHGITGLGQSEELNVFGSNATTWPTFHIHEDADQDYELSSMTGLRTEPAFPSISATNVPKRSSSLRKSTLQQRYGDRGSLGRRTGERQLAQMSSEFSPVRSRPRLSLDQFLPPHVPRDSPFTSTSPLPSASTHPMDNKIHQPHPLSKTLTTSSSGNSLTEESPHFAPPARVADRHRPHPFSRSLPLNATRPTRPNDTFTGVATPNKSQLWVGAFSSTGLISKVNRNPEEEADKKMAPPDTPCKKHSNPFYTFPPPAGSAMKKRGNNRNSFGGIPSTPFNPISNEAPDTFGNPGKGLSIFQRGNASRSARRGSVLSLDGDDNKLFGDFPEPQTSMEGYAPPTPTKNSLGATSIVNLADTSFDETFANIRESPSANRTFQPPTSAVREGVSRESTSSPLGGRRTPQTPQESLLPLDTSRLSISQAGDLPEGMQQPVTPTAGRDFRSSTSLLVTPVNARTSNVDVDESLYSRFDKVEQIGKGEFSLVYRVTTTVHRQSIFKVSTTPSDRLRSPAKEQVYAVKKAKHAYQGIRDREMKLQEAQILKSLSHADHVVKYVDDWEHNNHLYIQTEFCEEGTLDKFLSNIGRGGRLDDFRIFKILQDLCLGLKEIHDAGFMHLDLKPANILITFEGVLKIGDFGLAQPYSANEGVDIEGDREYMAPEMLKGKATRSADVFSLGLITLEAAANVALPDNGPTWVALRSGDLSEVPSLTWTSSVETERNATGNPTESSHSDELGSGRTHNAGNLFGSFKRSELQQPPDFMVSAWNPSSLDSIVRWMTAQEPSDRPTADQVLELEGLRWVAERRAAPATVYEGNWGPVAMFPDVINVSPSVDMDTEMTDV